MIVRLFPRFLLLVALFLGTACAKSLDHQLPTQADAEGIYGGESTDYRDPATSSVVKIIGAGGTCTGVVIAQDVIATAAHCLGDDVDHLLLQFEDREGTMRRSNRLMRHPNFVHNHYPDHNRWDIAILVFKGGLPAGVKSAKIYANLASLPAGTPILAIGNGATVLDGSDGAGVIRKVFRPLNQSQFSSIELTLDFSWQNGVGGGDSGGPALIKVGNEYQVLGVLSGHSNQTSRHKFFIMYTRLDAFRDWIAQASAQLRAVDN